MERSCFGITRYISAHLTRASNGAGAGPRVHIMSLKGIFREPLIYIIAGRLPRAGSPRLDAEARVFARDLGGGSDSWRGEGIVDRASKAFPSSCDGFLKCNRMSEAPRGVPSCGAARRARGVRRHVNERRRVTHIQMCSPTKNIGLFRTRSGKSHGWNLFTVVVD